MPLRLTLAAIIALCATLSMAQSRDRRTPAAPLYRIRQDLSLGLHHNPATLAPLADTSLSSISTSYHALGNIFEQCQQGNAWHGWQALGSTFLRISPSISAWGNASYRKGTRHNVLLSENADYNIIHPMAVADSVGGHKDSERYAFLAGFAYQGHRANLGLQISYSSTSEYRNTDPRPKADAIDANLRIGATLLLPNTHHIGLFASLRKYAQDLSLKFFNAYKASMTIYHLQGLATNYTRFSGTYDATQYRGRGIAAGLTYQSPINITLLASRMHTEKSLDDLQNAVISETLRNSLALTLSRQSHLRQWRTTSTLHASLSLNKLTQHIYDDGTSNYHRLSSRSPYSHHTSSITLSLSALSPNASSHNASSSPQNAILLNISLTHQTSREEETDYHNLLQHSSLTLHAQALAHHDFSHTRLSYALTLSHRSPLSHNNSLTTPRPLDLPNARTLLTNNFNRQTTPLTTISPSLRLDLPLLTKNHNPHSPKTIYILLSPSLHIYHNNTPNPTTLSLTTGITL